LWIGRTCTCSNVIETGIGRQRWTDTGCGIGPDTSGTPLPSMQTCIIVVAQFVAQKGAVLLLPQFLGRRSRRRRRVQNGRLLLISDLILIMFSHHWQYHGRRMRALHGVKLGHGCIVRYTALPLIGAIWRRWNLHSSSSSSSRRSKRRGTSEFLSSQQFLLSLLLPKRNVQFGGIIALIAVTVIAMAGAAPSSLHNGSIINLVGRRCRGRMLITDQRGDSKDHQSLIIIIQ